MDTNKEFLQTKYAPGRNFEALAVAFAMNYMQQHPGTKSLCDMADALRVTPECMEDLVEQAGKSKLLSGQRPDRLEQLASVNEVRYDSFLKYVEKLNRVADPAFPSQSVDAEQLALARFYLNSHNNSRYRTLVSRVLGVDEQQLNRLFYEAGQKALFRNENLGLLEKFANERINEYNKFLDNISDVLYVRSDIEPGKKLEDLIVGFAVNYINKHPGDDELKAKVFACLKVDSNILAELYRKAQKRPVLNGYVVETLGKLAQLNWKRYITFTKRVNDTDLKVQVMSGELVERMIPSRELGAAVYLIGKGELSPDQICQVWGLSREGFDDAMGKYTSSEEFLHNYVDNAELREQYIQRISHEIETLRTDADEVLNPRYKVSGEQGVQNINTVSDDERVKYLQYHPDVFAGLDKDNTTYRNAMIACKANGLALEHVVNKAPRLVDYQLCMAAVQSNGYALKWVKRAWRDRKMCYAAVSNDYNAYKFVPRSMKSERKLMHLAITPFGGGHNIQYAFQKDKSKYLCHMADRTFAEAREYFPQKFAPSDNDLKKLEKKMKEEAKLQRQPTVKVTPQDYFSLYPSLVKEAREAVTKNFPAVRTETEQFVRNVAAFYNGSLSASKFLAEAPMAGRYPADADAVTKYRMAVMDTFACAARHPELVDTSTLNVHFKPSVARDFSSVTLEDYYGKLMNVSGQDQGVQPTTEGLMAEAEVKMGVVHLLKQEAELAVAYRNNEISAEQFLSTLPVGIKVPQGTPAELGAYADNLSQYWADRFPEMIKNHEQEKQSNQERSHGVKMHL